MSTDQTPSTALAVAGPQRTPALADRLRYAHELAQADLLPGAYRGKPANVLLAMEYGTALGLSAVVAMQHVHVVDGKPTPSSQLAAALVRRHGHRLRVTGDEQRAVAEVVRADDPGFTFRTEWTLERARAAGLLGRDNWRKHPGAMLKAAAIREVTRDACPEVLAGVDAGEVVIDAAADDPAGPVDVSDALVLDDIDVEPMITQPQLAKIGAQMRDLGITGRESALEYVAEVVGRPIESRSDLTRSEAGALIEHMADQLGEVVDELEVQR